MRSRPVSPMPRSVIGLAPFRTSGFALAAALACSARVEHVDPLVDMLIAVCERHTRCNCTSTSEDCEASGRSRAAELRIHADGSGANRFDAECADLIRQVAEQTCVAGGIAYESANATIAALAARCEPFLFHGDRRVGESCEHPSLLIFLQSSDCEADALCLESDDGPRCVSWPPAGVGDLCRDGDIGSWCPVDLACIPAGDSTEECLPLTEIGAPCAGIAADYCEGAPGQWCDPATSTCRALPGPDAPCIEPPESARHRCAAGLYCDARCNYDAYCDDGTCRARPGPGEVCIVLESCALGLDCNDGICEGDEACFLP